MGSRRGPPWRRRTLPRRPALAGLPSRSWRRPPRAGRRSTRRPRRRRRRRHGVAVPDELGGPTGGLRLLARRPLARARLFEHGDERVGGRHVGVDRRDHLVPETRHRLGQESPHVAPVGSAGHLGQEVLASRRGTSQKSLAERAEGECRFRHDEVGACDDRLLRLSRRSLRGVSCRLTSIELHLGVNLLGPGGREREEVCLAGHLGAPGDVARPARQRKLDRVDDGALAATVGPDDDGLVTDHDVAAQLQITRHLPDAHFVSPFSASSQAGSGAEPVPHRASGTRSARSPSFESRSCRRCSRFRAEP